MSDQPRDDAPEEQEDELRQVSPEELKDILEKHERWLDSEGEEGKQADLSRCDLQEVHLTGVNLKRAELFKTNLQRADLMGANLQQAEACCANLKEADLRHAHSQHAILFRANLEGASLDGAKLHGALLEEANLKGASLFRAKLQEAKLSRARLEHAHLRRANLTNTRMHEVVIDDETFFDALVFGPDHDPFNDGHDQIKIPDRDRWLNWGWIRVIGQLPLFGVSWASLAISLTYINTAGLLNSSDWIGIIGHKLPIPLRMGLILTSSILLVIGSTMFKLICPPRIQEFSETQWVESRNRPRLLYYIESWRRRAWQLPTLLLTAAGGLLGLGLVLERLWWAATYLWQAWGAS